MAQDLRSFLAGIGDLLLRVPRPVAIDHVCALIAEARRPVLFEAVDGFPGWSLCDLLFRDRAVQARVLGTTPDKVLSVLSDRLALPPRPPRLVDGESASDEVATGAGIDLRRLPGFQHGARDPGRCLIAMTVCRPPDGGAVNFAFSRLYPIDATRATYLIGSSPHMRAILAAWEARGEAMPMALVIGTHPAYEIMASYSVPTHLERFGELDLVGNLLGEDVELVGCRTVALAVPAHAEVVIEGVVRPGVRAEDPWGPSQYLYYHPGASQQPVFEATLLATRTRPILRQHATTPFTDHQSLLSLPHEAILYGRLREQGIPVHDVLYVPWGGTLTCVVQMTPEYDGQVADALMHLLSSRWPSTKMAIAVDQDVDIEDPADLHWALATRVDPQRDVFVVPNGRGHRGDPSSRPIDGAPGRTVVGKWGIDATKPPLNRAAERTRYDRALPKHYRKVRLADYLA
jgi:2,5-furandicarboxylate decarboxylase 1